MLDFQQNFNQRALRCSWFLHSGRKIFFLKLDTDVIATSHYVFDYFSRLFELLLIFRNAFNFIYMYVHLETQTSVINHTFIICCEVLSACSTATTLQLLNDLRQCCGISKPAFSLARPDYDTVMRRNVS